MAFSVETWRAAQRPWTCTVRGRTYTARPLSAPRVAAFLGEMEGAGHARGEQLLRALLREAFPKRLSMRWRGDPVEYLMQLPVAGRRAMLADFFDSLGIAAGAILARRW